jgi:REP-associated tyrosine transposase
MSPNRPPRLEGFSYIGFYQYFVTVCTSQRRVAFREDEQARWLIEQITQLFASKEFAVIAYCVMPDHVHVLLEGLTETADFAAAMHDWKQVTAFAWKQRTGERLWQEGFYEHVLREEESVPSVVKYILENPARAGLTNEGTGYPYMGSSRYSLEQLEDAIADWRPRRRRV